MKASTQLDYADRMRRVLRHIQSNLDAELSLSELATIACFSPFHFHRVFRGMVRESLHHHVRRLRLERAALELLQSSQPITRIALAAGFETHEAFTRAFRAAFGCAPRDYRDASTLAPHIDAPNGVHFNPSLEAVEARFEQELRMDVEVVCREAFRVAFVRHQGPYQEVAAAWEKLLDWAGAHCLFGAEHFHMGACWNDPEATPPEEIVYDACIGLGGVELPADEIAVTTVDGGRFAQVLHQGPYDRIGETYAALLGVWFATHPEEPGEPPAYEFYLNDPDSTEPEDLLTEILVRIR